MYKTKMISNPKVEIFPMIEFINRLFSHRNYCPLKFKRPFYTFLSRPRQLSLYAYVSLSGGGINNLYKAYSVKHLLYTNIPIIFHKVEDLHGCFISCM